MSASDQSSSILADREKTSKRAKRRPSVRDKVGSLSRRVSLSIRNSTFTTRVGHSHVDNPDVDGRVASETTSPSCKTTRYPTSTHRWTRSNTSTTDRPTSRHKHTTSPSCCRRHRTSPPSSVGDHTVGTEAPGPRTQVATVALRSEAALPHNIPDTPSRETPSPCVLASALSPDPGASSYTSSSSDHTASLLSSPRTACPSCRRHDAGRLSPPSRRTRARRTTG